MSFPRHTSYKDSEVGWLGEVPAHWEVKAIKWISPVLRGASPRPIDDQKYFDDDGEYAWVRIADSSASDGTLLETTQRLSELGSSLSVKLHPGELFVSIAGTVGKPCIAGIKCCIHDGFVYFPRLTIDPGWLYRLFEHGACYAGLGKMGTQLNLNTDTIGSIRIGVPPVKELQAILKFVGVETGKIDALVEEQGRLIELLKEKRQAVISQAVTKGLDPNVPMKDSGVEWLGKVPAAWHVTPLKRLCALLKDGTHLPPARVAEGVPLLSVRNVQGGVFSKLDDDSMISEESYKELCRSFVPQSNDVLLAIVGATLGKTALVPEDIGRFHIQRSLAIFRPEGELTADWLHLIFQSSGFQALLWESVGFSAQPGIYLGTLAEVRVPVPPLHTQTDIVRAVGRDLNRLNQLITEAESGVMLLGERRSALISAAVTGKIDVRGLVPQPEAVAA